MEFNSVAITAAGSGVDAVALEWLEHTIRTDRCLMLAVSDLA